MRNTARSGEKTGGVIPPAGLKVQAALTNHGIGHIRHTGSRFFTAVVYPGTDQARDAENHKAVMVIKIGLIPDGRKIRQDP